jgi:hypothetical protein
VYRFSPAANTWTTLSPSGSGPSRREGMGFAATPDGMLYVFGGNTNTGTDGGGVGITLDAVMRRARAAPLLLSLADGMRVRWEETCVRAPGCVYHHGVCLWRASGPHLCLSIEGRQSAGIHCEEGRSAQRQVLPMHLCLRISNVSRH